ncbi:transcription factor tfiie complex alpha [Grosmannia clavigera kw1407]|uniref:Transcription factor tfiie complex alpha n=1 Tax=Grosmannia clavigera (strain kw1407 / UAMH 11150) TaxID=655863 RepID=F0XMB4_GROCL|nr:transcription factor tfiie complex alpha [Grosmannia clavigera kw1407]EFX01335.1 transcription factor tfiie complex alpha [Grosmannia clavigera kw1407]
MDLAKTLVRSVARAFYETKHILIIDALVIHSAVPDDDLAYLISMNIKDLRKMCQKLREDRLLVSHSRSELREGQQRPNNRTYYYIDYRQTIDAIKWRVYKIDKDLQGPVVPPSEKKEYFCDRCKAEWTQMEVLDSSSTSGFLCHRCGSVLRHGDGGRAGGHERSTRMNNQFKFITELLPKIDSVVIPDNNFEVAFNNKRPVLRDATHQIAASIGVDAMNRPTAVKGLANTGPSTLSVSIQAGSGPTEEEKAAERERRERVAAQNALPSWMSNSTVTGEAFKTDLAPGKGPGSGADADTKDPTIKATNDTNAEADIDDYFSRLKRQAAEEARKKMAGAGQDDEDEDEEDEDDAEFEDVVQTAGSTPVASGTPGSSNAIGLAPPTSVPPPRLGSIPKAPSPLRQSYSQSNLKREAVSEPPSPSEAGRLAKKVKVEDEIGEVPVSAVKAQAEDSDEDEDDIEFEDV